MKEVRKIVGGISRRAVEIKCKYCKKTLIIEISNFKRKKTKHCLQCFYKQVLPKLRKELCKKSLRSEDGRFSNKK